MCGIFGWAGKDPKKFNKMKFDMLGVLNEKRGTDSCGVTVDGEVYIGAYANKVYRDFVVNKGYPLPEKYPVVIGHTRASSVGSKSEDNAHPFGFGGGKEGYEFIGVHNGTLLNHKELAPKYKVELRAPTVVENKHTTVHSTREKIDSELLLECIYKSKGFEPLNDYNGAAALMFTNTNEPNALYMYHGASLLKNYTQDGVFEERPLFIWKENKHSMYISSIKDSLITIGGIEKDIETVPHNRVYKVVNGTIKKTTTSVIKREERWQNHASNPNTRSHTNYGRNARPRNCNHHNNRLMEAAGTQHQMNLDSEINSQNSSVKIKNESNIHKEKPVFKSGDIKERSVFKNFRYRRNGTLLDGMFIYIKGYGFYKLGDDYTASEQYFKSLINKAFTKKNFPAISKEFIRKDYIPLLFGDPFNVSIRDYIQYLHKGVHIKTPFDYYACLDMKKIGREFDFMALSACAKHPVINIDIMDAANNKQLIYYNNEIYNGTISPLGADRIYTIDKGNCINMSICKDLLDENGNDQRTKKNPKVIDLVKFEDSNILKNVEESIVNEEKMKTKKEQDKLLDNLLENIFNESFQATPMYLEKLQKFEDNPKAKKAIEVLNIFMIGTQEIMGVEQTD